MSITIEELEKYFSEKEIPVEIVLNRSTTITDTRRYIASALHQAKTKGTDAKFGNGYNKLVALRSFLENGQLDNDSL